MVLLRNLDVLGRLVDLFPPSLSARAPLGSQDLFHDWFQSCKTRQNRTVWGLIPPYQRRRRCLISRMEEETAPTSKVGTSRPPTQQRKQLDPQRLEPKWLRTPSLSLSLFLCLSLSPRDVVCCVVWCVSLLSWCCWWSWCVFGLSVCVCCGTLNKRGKTRVWIQKRPRVYIQNVPVCTGTTRTCVSTCARGAGTHGDVLNVHTGTFSMDTRGRFQWTHGGRGSSPVLLTKNCPRKVIT